MRLYFKIITIGFDKQKFECRIVNVFLPTSCNICLGAQKNHLIETVLLSIHNICFRVQAGTC